MSVALVGLETQIITRQREGIEAVITVFGDQDFMLHGTLSNVGEDGAQLKLDRRVPPSTLVKIEYADSFLLGEVLGCQAQGQDWIARVKVEHGLFRLTELNETIRENWG